MKQNSLSLCSFPEMQMKKFTLPQNLGLHSLLILVGKMLNPVNDA